jgi:ubiquinone/menaquinone biosynthesis C-methylase UbiE
MSESHAPEHFADWNEQMIRKYDPDVFHHHPKGIVRWVETRRTAAVLRSIAAKPEHSILDVGCGTGTMLSRLPGNQRIGIDLSRFMVNRARERLGSSVQVLLGDAEELPFPTASFDRVIASSLFSHVLHPDRVAAELKRVLKPGGRIVVSVSDEDQIEKGMLLAHVLLFDRFFLRQEGQVRVFNVEYHLHKFSRKRMRDVMGEGVVERSLRRVPTVLFPVHWVAIYEHKV